MHELLVLLKIYLIVVSITLYVFVCLYVFLVILPFVGIYLNCFVSNTGVQGDIIPAAQAW